MEEIKREPVRTEKKRRRGQPSRRKSGLRLYTVRRTAQQRKPAGKARPVQENATPRPGASANRPAAARHEQTAELVRAQLSGEP
ncbi:MAG: hypothetical protein ACLT76_13820 [Clostridium fessum]